MAVGVHTYVAGFIPVSASRVAVLGNCFFGKVWPLADGTLLYALVLRFALASSLANVLLTLGGGKPVFALLLRTSVLLKMLANVNGVGGVGSH